MVAVETANVLKEYEVLAVGAVKTSHPYSCRGGRDLAARLQPTPFIARADLAEITYGGGTIPTGISLGALTHLPVSVAREQVFFPSR
jgi:hypothetical protein